MKQKIQQLFAEIVTSLGVSDAVIHVEIPENAIHGDYTTNVAMTISSRLKAPPMKIAQQIVERIIKYQKESAGEKANWIEKAEVAPPGFINLWLSEEYFGNQIQEVLKEKEQYGMVKKNRIISNQSSVIGKKQTKQKKIVATVKNTLDTSPKIDQVSSGSAGKEDKKESVALFGKTIMVEFAHPNTHKAFHIGHLRNITTGESIVRLLESQRNRVIRANYQGDVGMHIAKCLYGILQVQNSKFKIQNWKDAKRLSISQRVEYLGEMYAAGSKAFEDSDEAKKAIGEINKQIYAKDPDVYELYKETRQWSLDYFDGIYKRVGSHYDRLYFESEFYELGKQFVRDGVKKGIFEESKGAIIFPGEKFGLHNRVFVTGEGNATYEGKEIALGRAQFDEYHPDLVIHVVGPEQAGYFQVLFKALEQVFPDTAGKEFHLVYGWVKLKQGKMSSRTGNVVLGEWLLDEAKKSIYEIVDKSTSESIAEVAAVAAVKYAFLKVGTNQEIAFDLKESVSFEGDSGPYLLYTYARCKSVLRKASEQSTENQSLALKLMNGEERAVARRIAQFPEVVADAAFRFAPNTLCTYLFQLAQEFNAFYANNPILGEPRRLDLTSATAQVLKNGLYLLGIPTVERM